MSLVTGFLLMRTLFYNIKLDQLSENYHHNLFG